MVLQVPQKESKHLHFGDAVKTHHAPKPDTCKKRSPWTLNLRKKKPRFFYTCKKKKRRHCFVCVIKALQQVLYISKRTRSKFMSATEGTCTVTAHSNRENTGVFLTAASGRVARVDLVPTAWHGQWNLLHTVSPCPQDIAILPHVPM